MLCQFQGGYSIVISIAMGIFRDERLNDEMNDSTGSTLTTRLGSPDDLKYLIDKLHEAGLELLGVGVCWGKTPCFFWGAPFFFLFFFTPNPWEMIQFD